MVLYSDVGPNSITCTHDHKFCRFLSSMMVCVTFGENFDVVVVSCSE